jgi:hypothetical protein
MCGTCGRSVHRAIGMHAATRPGRWFEMAFAGMPSIPLLGSAGAYPLASGAARSSEALIQVKGRKGRSVKPPRREKRKMGDRNEEDQSEASNVGCRRRRVRRVRFNRLDERRSFLLGRKRTGAGGTTVDTCKRRWRCTPDDATGGRRWSGGRRCCRGLRARLGERQIRLPLGVAAFHRNRQRT